RVVQGDLAGVARLITTAPDVDAGHAPGAEPASHRGEHRAAAAAHVEDPLVALEPEAVEDALPLHELPAPGGVEEAAHVSEEEEEVDGQHPRHARLALPPTDRRPRPGAQREH